MAECQTCRYYWEPDDGSLPVCVKNSPTSASPAIYPNVAPDRHACGEYKAGGP